MKIYTSMMQGGSIPPNPKDRVIPVPCPPPLDVHETFVAVTRGRRRPFHPYPCRAGERAPRPSGGVSGAAAGMEEQQCAAA